MPAARTTRADDVSWSLGGASDEHAADMTNGSGRVQPLWTDINAVLDAVAAKHTERVAEFGQALFGSSVAAVGQEAIRLQ